MDGEPDNTMKYHKALQFIPMRGMAAMYYEIDEEALVKRFMTVMPDSGEVERAEKPPMKRLFKPELLEEVPAEEFESYWNG
jgi:hypothetical protein